MLFLQPELTATPERTEALLTALCLPTHMLQIMRAGLGLQQQRPTTTWLLEKFAFSDPDFFTQTFVDTVLVHQGGPNTLQEHLANYLVTRPPFLHRRLEVALLDMGECARGWVRGGAG